MTIECLKYIPLNKNNCLGIASIFVPKWGIEIHGISLHEKDGRRWINFPSRAYEKDGVKKYQPYFRFPNNDHYNLFCKTVKEAIERHLIKDQGPEPEQDSVPF